MREVIKRSLARSRGLVRFFSGKPCPKGHLSERYVIGGCVECRSIYAAAHRKKNLAAILAGKRAYAAQNKELINDSASDYREKNRQRLREAQARYRAEKPEIVSANNRNRKAKKKKAVGRHTAAELRELLARQKNRCAICDCDLSAGKHADHMLPIARGGSNDIGNIQWLCPPCNLFKATYTMEELERLLVVAA